jgi:dihydroorotate dehydrogenase
MEFTTLVDGRLAGTGKFETVEVDQLFTAIGQTLAAGDAIGSIAVEHGRIRVDDTFKTSNPSVWAGGDCVAGGDDLTVTAVAQGRDAAGSNPRSLVRREFGYEYRGDPNAREIEMADLRHNFVGIKSPNPFWLASAPPTDKEYNVVRAFKAGWGGVVWKTLGLDPHIVNVGGPRYGAIWGADRRLLGLNNIELITDRPLDVNLQEIKSVKKAWPDRALVTSLMVPCEEPCWEGILRQVEDTECDGVELNFGCPHGMSERGMGAAVGQVPEYIEMVTRWCKDKTRMPVIVKLTPNITDVRYPARAAKAGGADAVSLINTISSIISVDLDQFAPEPTIDGKGTHGGYCGPAVKPIALNMVASIARDAETAGLPISGIGGVTTWRDAAEFLTLGAENVQGLYSRNDLWVQDYRRACRRAGAVDGQCRPCRPCFDPWPRAAECHRVAISEPELYRQGTDRPGQLHQVWPLSYRV